MTEALYLSAAFGLGLATNLLARKFMKRQQQDSLIENYIAISGKANAILEKKRASETDIDPYTGRISRKHAIKRNDKLIRASIKEEDIATIAIFNPVDFHKVNEAYGYENGDLIIMELYTRLRDYLRNSKETKNDATLAVTESANFLIWMPIGMEINDVIVHLNNMNDIIKKPITLDDKVLNIFSSIGYVIVPDEIDIGEDVYLALEKITKRNALPNAISTLEEMKDDFSHKSAIVEDMISKALQEDSIEAHLQPIVNTQTNKLEAAEVLARLRVDDEIISPGVFIPVAERTGLIDEIAIRIVDKSLKVLNSMREKGQLLPHFYLSINFTTHQIGDPSFIDKVVKMTEAKKIPTKHIQLEITESVFSDNDLMFEIINDLVDRGFRVTMDDFGTGYSSLKQLSRLKVTGIKIDRSFVTDIHRNEKNRKLVKAINSIAKSLDMHVVVEGVETEKELASIQALGMNSFQGFYFFKPMHSEHFIKMIHRD